MSLSVNVTPWGGQGILTRNLPTHRLLIQLEKILILIKYHNKCKHETEFLTLCSAQPMECFYYIFSLCQRSQPLGLPPHQMSHCHCISDA